MSKIQNYFNQQFEIMSRLYPNENPEKLKSVIKEIILERNAQKEKSEIMIEFPDPEVPIIRNVPISNLEKKLEKEKPILTKYGTAFYRQDEKESILAQMMSYMAAYRKKHKDLMLQHLNDEDQTEYNRLDIIQKTIKILMNSFYGVLTAKGSIFRSLDCGESVTHTGELIIMTAISIFERFLTNNIHFYSETDMIIYCNNIIKENYSCLDDFDVRFKNDINIDELMDYFYNHYTDLETAKYIKKSFDKNTSVLYKFLKTLNKDQFNRIYYKNNLMKFLDNALLYDDEGYVNFVDCFKEILSGVFLNPNKPSEEQELILKDLWCIINDWVFYNYQNYHKYNECSKGDRNTVLTVDTDSNFIYLGTVYLFFKHKFPEIIDDSKEKKVTSLNSITYFLTNVINSTYLKLTEESNIPESYRPLINMKNEFMLARILLTKNKKHYATSVLMREGELMSNAKIDIKGLAIKKVDTNKYVRKYFTDILSDDIINAERIDYSNIISKYFKFSDTIKDSLLSGETKFSIPGKANEVSSYVEPYNIQVVRGILLWNILFPEDEIRFPNSVNMFKLSIPNDIEYFERKIREYFESKDKEIDLQDFNEFLSRMKEAMNEEKLFKEGEINIISFPKTLKKCPDYIIPFIKVDRMVYDQLNAGTILLDCLDIQTPKINNNLVPTNILKI